MRESQLGYWQPFLLFVAHNGDCRALIVLGRDDEAGNAARTACSAAHGMAEGGAGTMAAWRYQTVAAAASLMALHAAGAWRDAPGACTHVQVGAI